VRKNVQMALAGKLQTLSTAFRRKHKHYLHAISERKRKTDGESGATVVGGGNELLHRRCN